MTICIATPARPGTRHGNRVTAKRWSAILRALGHRVRIRTSYDGRACDLLVALHARKSAPAIEAAGRSGVPVVLALTGTDVYRDLGRSPRARRALDAAWRVIVLQPLALDELPKRLRPRARVVYQSVVGPRRRQPRSPHAFEVVILAHLRPEKDPFRAALAARRLPASSRIRVLQMGAAMTPAMTRRARAEERRNPRYRWLGDRPRPEALRILARARLMVLSSRLEGGANAASEALAARVPVLASRIPGTVGLFGERYPGFFPVADTVALAQLLHRAETDSGFRAGLATALRARRHLISPSLEKRAWKALLKEWSHDFSGLPGLGSKRPPRWEPSKPSASRSARPGRPASISTRR